MIQIRGVVIKLWSWYVFIPSLVAVSKLADFSNKTITMTIKEEEK